MARSLKHTHVFKYKRHTRVFDNIESEVNDRELRRELASLHARQAKGEHIEIQRLKNFSRTDRTRRGRSSACYSLRFYTRKDMGLKPGVQAAA